MGRSPSASANDIAWLGTILLRSPSPDQALFRATPPLFCYKELCRHPPWPTFGSAAAARSAPLERMNPSSCVPQVLHKATLMVYS